MGWGPREAGDWGEASLGSPLDEGEPEPGWRFKKTPLLLGEGGLPKVCRNSGAEAGPGRWDWRGQQRGGSERFWSQ